MRTEAIRCARPVPAADGGADATADGGAHGTAVAAAGRRADALAQAQALATGTDAPARRWAHRADFTLLATGFGPGWPFLALWQAWRDDPQRPSRLAVVALDPHPPALDDLRRAHRDSPWPDLSAALLRAWPLPTPNLHPVEFDGGRVSLLLGFGRVRALLPQLTLRADAVWLVVDRTPGADAAASLPLLKAIARRCADGATLDGVDLVGSDTGHEAGGSGDDGVALRRHLRTTGFAVHGAPPGAERPGLLQAVFSPRTAPRRPRPAVRAVPTEAPPTPSGAGGGDGGGDGGGGGGGGGGDGVVAPHDIRSASTGPGGRRGERRGAAAEAAGDARDHGGTDERTAVDVVGGGGTDGCTATDVVVVGGGIAGAAVARELARAGRRVAVLDRHAQPASEASGHPAGLFHATVHDDDGPHARLLRAATLWAQRVYGEAHAAAGVPAGLDGLLRVEPPGTDAALLRARLARSGLPAALVDVADEARADTLSGLPLGRPAWWHRVGGWVAPAAWVRHALATPGIEWHGGADATRFERRDGRWCVYDDADRLLACAPVLVLAHGAAAAAAMAQHGHASWPLRWSRGQLAHGPAPAGTALAMPLAGDGYVVPFAGVDGRPRWLCGATREPARRDVRDATPPRPDDEAHRLNLTRLQRLTGVAVGVDAAGWQARAAWRLESADRLPVAGAVPAAVAAATGAVDAGGAAGAGGAVMAAGGVGACGGEPAAGATGAAAATANTPLSRWPRAPGLYVLTALGSRGLTLAPLLGRAVAALITGAPSPLERDLLDAVDPARWLQRSRRRAAAVAARDAAAASASPAPAP